MLSMRSKIKNADKMTSLKSLSNIKRFYTTRKNRYNIAIASNKL